MEAFKVLTEASVWPWEASIRPVRLQTCLDMSKLDIGRPLTGLGRPLTSLGRPLNGPGRPLTGLERPLTGLERPLTGLGKI